MELYQRWLSVQDFHFIKTAVTVKSWVGTLLVVLCLLAAVTFLPVHDSFQTKTAWCLVAFAPAFLLGVAGAAWNERGTVSPKTLATLALFGKALLIFAFGAFVSLTVNASGKLLFATLYLFVIGFQGWAVRSSLTDGVGFVPAVIGTGAAFLLDPTGTNRATFVLVGPFGLFLNLLLGTWARHHAKLIASVAEHREAIRLREAELEVFRLKQVLLGSWGNRHDIANVAATMVMSAEVLRRQELSEKAKRSADVLHCSATRIGKMLQTLQEEGKFEQASLVSVPVRAVIGEVVEGIHLRYPHVAFEVDVSDVSVRVVEGKSAFGRLLDNLLLNACQGDGKKSANQVTIRMSDEGEKVALVVEDNGPGFPDGFLEQHKVLKTTKTEGSGLGLHMIRTIVRTSGGDVEFSGSSRGGAKVTVHLFKE